MNKKGFETSELLKWVVGIAVLAIIALFIYSLSTGRLENLLQRFFEILRFRA